MTRALPLALVVSLASGCAPQAPEPERAAATKPAERPDRERVRRFWREFERAEALRRSGRWEEAAAIYELALRDDPRHEGALYGRANCLMELDRHAEALPHLQRLVQENPLSQRGHVQLAALRSAPAASCCFDLDLALAELERATEINREETGALLRLGELLIAAGRLEEARGHLAHVRQANTHSVGAPWLLAWLARESGRSQEAVLLLEEAGERERGPELPTAVPAEGDTRGDHRLVASGLAGKRAVPPLWEDLNARRPAAGWNAESAAQELSRLDAALARLP